MTLAFTFSFIGYDWLLVPILANNLIVNIEIVVVG